VARQAKTEMRIRSRQKDGSNGLIKETRLGGILSPVWYSVAVAMISSLLGLLLKKRLPLRQPCRGARPFAQVLAAIVLLVIATVAASTVARRPHPRPSVPNGRRRLSQANRRSISGSRCGAREVGAPYFLLPARAVPPPGVPCARALRAAPRATASGGFLLGLVSGSGLRHRVSRAMP